MERLFNKVRRSRFFNRLLQILNNIPGCEGGYAVHKNNVQMV